MIINGYPKRKMDIQKYGHFFGHFWALATFVLTMTLFGYPKVVKLAKKKWAFGHFWEIKVGRKWISKNAKWISKTQNGYPKMG